MTLGSLAIGRCGDTMVCPRCGESIYRTYVLVNGHCPVCRGLVGANDIESSGHAFRRPQINPALCVWAGAMVGGGPVSVFLPTAVTRATI